MSDSYVPEMAGPPATPSSAVLPWLAGLVAPHIRDYLTKPTPPQGPQPAYDKTPEDRNPNTAGAINEATGIASSFLPLGAAGRMTGAAANAISRFAPHMPGGAEIGLNALRDVAGAGIGAAAAPGPVEAAERGSKMAGRAQATPSPYAPPPATPQAPQPQVPGEPPQQQHAPGSMRPSFLPEDIARINQLEKEITMLAQRKQAAVSDTSQPLSGRRMTGDTFDAQIRQRQEELARTRGDMATKQNEFDRATQPIGVRNADAVAAARAGAMGGSLATGALHGLTHKPGIAPWIGSGVLGGLEGALGIVGPNLYDLGAPQGTAARDAAEHNLRFLSHPNEPGAWDYAQNVIAPEAAGGAGLGVTGHGVGHAVSGALGAVRRGVGSMFERAPPPSASPASPAPPGPPSYAPTSPKAKNWPSDPNQIKMMQDAGGRWREQGTGHYVPKHLTPAYAPRKPGEKP